jgi:hypothetical protein
VAAEGGIWRAYRADGAPEGNPGQISQVPEGYRPIGPEALIADDVGRLSVEDLTVLPGEAYSYVLARVGGAPGQQQIVYGPYGAQAPASAPAQAFLATAFPNPSSSEQTIAYGVPSTVGSGAVVRLELYNVRGAKVRTLVHRRAEPGRFVVTWNGLNDAGTAVPGGVYLYRLATGSEVLTGRLVRLQH